MYTNKVKVKLRTAIVLSLIWSLKNLYCLIFLSGALRTFFAYSLLSGVQRIYIFLLSGTQSGTLRTSIDISLLYGPIVISVTLSGALRNFTVLLILSGVLRLCTILTSLSGA